MKYFLLFLLALASGAAMKADATAVIGAARELRKLYNDAIPDDKRNDQRAVGHILSLRLSELDGEIAIQEGLRLQLAAAKKGHAAEMETYCHAFTIRSLDLLEQIVAQCVDTLRIAGLPVSEEATRAKAATLDAIAIFRKELDQDGSLSKEKG